MQFVEGVFSGVDSFACGYKAKVFAIEIQQELCALIIHIQQSKYTISTNKPSCVKIQEKEKIFVVTKANHNFYVIFYKLLLFSLLTALVSIQLVLVIFHQQFTLKEYLNYIFKILNKDIKDIIITNNRMEGSKCSMKAQLLKVRIVLQDDCINQIYLIKMYDNQQIRLNYFNCLLNSKLLIACHSSSENICCHSQFDGHTHQRICLSVQEYLYNNPQVKCNQYLLMGNYGSAQSKIENLLGFTYHQCLVNLTLPFHYSQIDSLTCILLVAEHLHYLKNFRLFLRLGLFEPYHSFLSINSMQHCEVLFSYFDEALVPTMKQQA